MSEIEILLFWVLILITYISYAIIIFKKLRVWCWKTLLVLLPAIFSTLCSINLRQNYKASILPQDGIAISNMLSYAIIGEDGWSTSLFYTYFNRSTVITLIALILLLAVFISDLALKGKSKSSKIVTKP